MVPEEETTREAAKPPLLTDSATAQPQEAKTRTKRKRWRREPAFSAKPPDQRFSAVGNELGRILSTANVSEVRIRRRRRK